MCLTLYFIQSSSWARKQKLEEFSKNLNYINPSVLKEREFLKTLGGPASVDLKLDIYKQKKSSVLENASFGLDKRFRDKKFQEPSPGE